jgi:hypothetical protein
MLSLISGGTRNPREFKLSTTSTSEQRKPAVPRREWGRPKEALEVFPGGLTKLYEMMNAGRIRSRKLDGMRLVHLGDAANPPE